MNRSHLGTGPALFPVADAAVRVVGDAPAADGGPAAVLGAGAVDAVHAHVVVLGVAAPVPWIGGKFKIQVI